MTRNLTEGKPMKVLFFFALPMLLGNVFQQLYNMADSIIVGRFVGSDALATVGGTYPVFFLAIAFATGSSTGCSIVISHAFGASDTKRVNKAICTAVILITTLGAIMMIISLTMLKPLLTLLRTDKDVFDASCSYLRIVFFGCIFIYIYNCLTAIFNALGDSKTPLKFLAISTILNIVLDLLFVVKFKLGSDGAGWATLIAQALATIGLSIYFVYKFSYLRNQKRSDFFDKKIAKDMIIYAIPSIIQQSIVSVGMMTVQGLVNSYGKDFVAGYSASTKIDSIAGMPMLNVSIALSTFTAQNIGARKVERVKKGYTSSLKLITIFSIISTTLLVLFGRYFIGFFVDSDVSKRVIQFGNDYFKIVSPFYLLIGFMFCTNGVHRGLGNMKVFMTATLTNFTARIVFAYLLKGSLGYHSIFWALPISWFIGGLISFLFYRYWNWEKKYTNQEYKNPARD